MLDIIFDDVLLYTLGSLSVFFIIFYVTIHFGLEANELDYVSYASGTTPSVVCGRIIGGTSDDTEHKIGRKIKKVRRGGKGKHKHGMKSCNVYYVNIDGFKSKIGSLQKILDEQNVGILLLTETKVYSKQSIKLHGYQVFSSVREKGLLGGGLLIAIRHGLCTSMMIDEGENAENALEVWGKCRKCT